MRVRELSIFIDGLGTSDPPQSHASFYVLSLVLHDQSDDITGHLDKIHYDLQARGLHANHAIHTGPSTEDGALWRTTERTFCECPK